MTTPTPHGAMPELPKPIYCAKLARQCTDGCKPEPGRLGDPCWRVDWRDFGNVPATYQVRAAIQQADQERVATMQEAMRQGTAHFYATCKTGLNGEDGALMRALELVYKYGRGSSAVEPRESGSVVGSIPTSGHPIQQAAGAVSEGWKLVPVEPTPEMLTASYYPDCNAPKRQEIYKTMLAASPTANSPTRWLPIETAPKDGTQILLGAMPQTYRGQPVAARATQGYWDAQKPLPGDYASDSGEFIGEPGGVPFWMSEDGGFTEENPPTHWQPMPAPPEFDDPGVAALPPIGTPGYGAALIALPHDYPIAPATPTLQEAVLALNAAWNRKEPEDVIAGHLDLCRRLAMLAAAPAPPKQQPDSVIQAITDPENQPSQYGTVTLEFHLGKIAEWESRFDRATSQQKVSGNSVHWGRGEGGGVPLSDEQISELIHEKHFAQGYVLRNSDLVCLDWYRLGLRDGEAAHGIGIAPTGQINPDSQEGDHG